jgi:hypothetical protein
MMRAMRAESFTGYGALIMSSISLRRTSLTASPESRLAAAWMWSSRASAVH